ncbi:threonine/serine ThrE exporter family protein [Cellulomonas carbonis]|uniref:threonine/serine ThrE exporter family protein n=2 Tax=Cellulomonas carbonis TaxID=1386092 RepID=UPI001665B647|nr:threonine/serine exporter family protein [Cellulomonas carbonis]
MRRRRVVRALAQRVGGGPSEVRAGLRSRPGGPDPVMIRDVLELALRVGEAMLSLGAAAVDVQQAVRGVVKAFGLTGAQADLTFTAITVSYDRAGDGRPVTMVRIVQERIPDYGRLQGVVELARRIREEPVAADDAAAALDAAHDELDAIISAPQTYRRWVVTVALSALAAAVAVLLGGGPAVALVAAVTTTLIDRVVWSLRRRGLPEFFLQAAGAAVAALVAVALFLWAPLVGIDLSVLPPSLVVAAGIVVLLAGLSLVGAAEDAISGFPITAGARTFEVVLLTAGIVTGIVGVLDVARRMGVPLVLADPPGALAPVPVAVSAAAVIAAAWAVASYARPRAVAVAAAAGAVSWGAFEATTALGVGPVVASAAAATVVGFLSEWGAPRLRMPSIVTSVCGIVPLLPGLAIYRGLFAVVEGGTGGLLTGVSILLGAAMVGLGIAAGVTLGEFLGAPLRLGTRGGGRARSSAGRGVTPRSLRRLVRRPPRAAR